MANSMSIGNQIHRYELVIASADNYSKDMPKEATTAATDLKRTIVRVRELAADQERMKQQLALATQQLQDALGAGRRLTSRIVRMAEATWGPRHPRIREFRPATEGRATKRAFKRREQPVAATPAPVAISNG